MYYPGQQESKPYQEIIVKLDALETSVVIDSMKYGNQTLALKPNQNSYYGLAQGISFSNKATLYYSRNNKAFQVEIDSISRLDPLYLP